MTKQLAPNPFLHLESVTVKWVVDKDADQINACRLLEGLSQEHRDGYSIGFSGSDSDESNPYDADDDRKVDWQRGYDQGYVDATATAYGCRVRATILVEGYAGRESYADTFFIETSSWGTWDPDSSYRNEIERELLEQLKDLLESRLGVDTTNFNERRNVDHFGKPVHKPNGSCF